MPDHEGQSEGAAPLDHDLYCLYCGYNLRGLSGDPVRCPECSKLNAIADLTIPANMIRKQLRRMETGPALCAAVFMFGVLLPGLISSVLWLRRGPAPLDALACPAAVSCVALVIWGVGCLRFRKSCLAKPGWAGALLSYHLWALALFGALFVVLPAFMLWLFGLLGRTGLFVLLAALILARCTFLRRLPAQLSIDWIHRRALARLVPLQREVAVTMAREEMRKTMARQ